MKTKQIIAVKGKVISGLGFAHETLAKQKKHFIELGLPGIVEYFNGTINLDLSPAKIKVIRFDYLFKQVKWEDGWIEDFGFVAWERLEFEWQIVKAGYLYFPFSSTHARNTSHLELITYKIQDIGDDKEVVLNLDLSKVQLV